ncbi:MAG TPA: hypothetical protein VM940_00200 [Chthoniobacterales bacterium]|nr:hypothetical protein [Chthoniobacterales bacterium]
MAHPNLSTKQRTDKLMVTAAKRSPSLDIPVDAKSISANLPSLVGKLTLEAEAEERLLDALAQAVRRGNRNEVFQTATRLIGHHVPTG